MFLLHRTEHTARTMAAMTTITTASTTPTTTPATRPALASLSACPPVVGAMDVADDASSVEVAALLPSPEGGATLASLSDWVITVLLVSIGGDSLVARLVDGGLEVGSTGSNNDDNGCVELEADIVPPVAVVVVPPLPVKDTWPKEYTQEE